MAWQLMIRWTHPEERSDAAATISMKAGLTPRQQMEATSAFRQLTPRQQMEATSAFRQLPPTVQAVLKARADHDPGSVTFEAPSEAPFFGVTYYFKQTQSW